ETVATVHERTEDVLEKLARKHRSGTIVLVATEPLASFVRQRLEGGALGDLWRATNGCNKMNVLHLDAILETPAPQNGAKNGSSPVVYTYRGATVNGQ